MAAKPADLGDFFKGKAKKKIKATNLNTATSAGAKPEAAKAKKKDEGDDGWEEEAVIAPTMKVDTAKLPGLPQDDKKEEEDVAAPVWGAVKGPSRADPTPQGGIITDRKFPTLAKSVQSTNINIDDGSDAKVNISTVKNAFAALDDGDGGDDDGSGKRPKEIKPSMIKKKQGEKEKDVLKREVDKYVPGEQGAKEPEKKDIEKKKKKVKRDAEDDEEDGDDKKDEDAAVEEDDDVRMEPDTTAAKAKYKGRKKLPKQDLPRAEMEEEREARPQKSKKKMAVVEDW